MFNLPNVAIDLALINTIKR